MRTRNDRGTQPLIAQWAKSWEIPKIVIVFTGIFLALIVAAVVGVRDAAHHVRRNAAQMQAQAEMERSHSVLTEAAKAAQNGDDQAPVDAPPLNGIPGIDGSGSTSSTNSGSAGSPVSALPGATPASPEPSPTEPVPIVPVAATGEQAHDWALKYERTENGAEADLLVRTGDINNLGFGWPTGFDPFSGQSTPSHPWPDPQRPPLQEPDGTDRIMIGTGLILGNRATGDGYSGWLVDSCASAQDGSSAEFRASMGASCKHTRQTTMPAPIVLPLGTLPAKINAVLVQIFVDDFQPMVFHSHFQVSLNGTRIPTFEGAINALDQSGPIGKLLTLRLLPEYWPLLQSGTVKVLIDDRTTHVPDGYAIDFVRILVNPRQLKYQVSLSATVTDADKHTPIAGATVNAALESSPTDRSGKCELKGVPAGLVVATATAPGYDENSVTVDLPAGQAGHADIQLHVHQESTGALEQAVAQTGTAAIYGIHFDTDSSKLRPDSLPALKAVVGLINNHPGSRWIIGGHTDNQGSASHNETLSESRAKSVVTWLKEHGVDAGRLEHRGFGATQPIADNSTANGQALNRRVEVTVAK